MSSAAGIRRSLTGSTKHDRIQPRTIARAAQLGLVAIVVIAAVITAPADRPAPADLPDLDQRAAAFADAAADGLATLQEEQPEPFGSGFLGTDRGQLFASGGTNYDQSIADLLIERALVDGDEAAELARNGVRLVAHQCADRVGVLVTSNREVSAEANAWWRDNGCEPDFITLLAWPVYIAMGNDPERAS